MREYHGMKGTRLYGIWQNMKNRCRNCHVACYKDYGGRGITFCKEWNSFLGFYDWAVANGYNDDLTLDRIDVNGNYCPSNCRFVTRSVQARNKRNNIFVGDKLLCDIAKNKKEYTFLRERVVSGIPLDRPKRKLVRLITVKGQTYNLRDWARILGINSGTLHYYLEKYGVKYIEEKMAC